MDAQKKNIGFMLWNVVNVKRPTDSWWEIDLIGREKEFIAKAVVRKMTFAAFQELIDGYETDFGKPLNADDGCGYTIVNKNGVYKIEVNIVDASTAHYEWYLKINGKVQDIEKKEQLNRNLKEIYEKTRAEYEAWKELPQVPLENPLDSVLCSKCCLGLPAIVYMHLVGQLSTEI